MSVTPIFHDGVQITIAHLGPMTFSCPCPDIGRDLIVAVAFSSHCYTEGFDGECHEPHQIALYDAGGKPRVFCPVRHGLSAQLPALVASLPNRKVFQTAELRNYVFSVPIKTEGKIYQVFFMLQRAEQVSGIDLRLTVESAYPVDVAPTLPKRPGSIRFRILAYKILRREQVRFAAR